MAKKEKPWPTWDVLLSERSLYVRLNGHTPAGKEMQKWGVKNFEIAIPAALKVGHSFVDIDTQRKAAEGVAETLRRVEGEIGVTDSMWSLHNTWVAHYTDAKVKTKKVWSLCVACSNWSHVCGRPVYEEDRANGAVLCRLHMSAGRRKEEARIERAKRDAERQDATERSRLMQVEFDELWSMACEARGVEHTTAPRVSYGDPNRVTVDSEVLAMFLREIIG